MAKNYITRNYRWIVNIVIGAVGIAIALYFANKQDEARVQREKTMQKSK